MNFDICFFFFRKMNIFGDMKIFVDIYLWGGGSPLNLTIL